MCTSYAYTGTNHQVVIKTLWLHFWGDVMSSIFLWSKAKYKAICTVYAGSYFVHVVK